MDNPAQYPDLEALGYQGDATAAQGWLGVVWRALRREVPSLVADIEAGTLDVEDARDVVVAATLRILRNPEGFESGSGQLDDYSEAWKRADATQDVYFTAAELRRVRPVGASLSGFAGSIKYL